MIQKYMFLLFFMLTCMLSASGAYGTPEQEIEYLNFILHKIDTAFPPAECSMTAQISRHMTDPKNKYECGCMPGGQDCYENAAGCYNLETTSSSVLPIVTTREPHNTEAGISLFLETIRAHTANCFIYSELAQTIFNMSPLLLSYYGTPHAEVSEKLIKKSIMVWVAHRMGGDHMFNLVQGESGHWYIFDAWAEIVDRLEIAEPITKDSLLLSEAANAAINTKLLRDKHYVTPRSAWAVYENFPYYMGWGKVHPGETREVACHGIPKSCELIEVVVNKLGFLPKERNLWNDGLRLLEKKP